MTATITTFDPYRSVPTDSVGTTVEYFGEVTAALADERNYWQTMASGCKDPSARDAMYAIADRVFDVHTFVLANLAVRPTADYWSIVALPIPPVDVAASDLFSAISRRADMYWHRNDLGMSKALNTLADLVSERAHAMGGE